MKVNSNGVGINYTVEGKGPWVVLSHSLACNYSMWDEQADALRRHYRVLRFDTRGHGGSDRPGNYSIALMAHVVAVLLGWLGMRALVTLGHLAQAGAAATG